jgi:hypothetical protein
VNVAAVKQSGAASSSQQLNQGDTVQVATGYDSTKGIAGDLYAYKGTSGTTVDLATANYKDTATWTDLGTLNAGAVKESGTTSSSQPLNHGDVVKVAADYDSTKGVPGELYAYKGTSGTTVDLAIANYQDTGTWTDLGVLKYTSQGSNVTTNIRQLTHGDIVQVSDGFNALKGKAGDLYAYLGTSGATVDLAIANFNETTNWSDLGPAALQLDTALNDVTSKLQQLNARSSRWWKATRPARASSATSTSMSAARACRSISPPPTIPTSRNGKT